MRYVFLMSFLLCSCTGYKRYFDNSSQTGVKNSSVSEIEEMIVESDEGPDLFCPCCKKIKKIRRELVEIKDLNNFSLSKEELDAKKIPYYVNEKGDLIIKKPQTMKRIWIHGTTTPQNSYVEGRYVYFVTNDDCWVVLSEGNKGPTCLKK